MSAGAAAERVTAGVDVGGTKIQAVVVRGEEVVGSARELTPQTGDAKDVIDAVVATIHASLAEAGAGGEALQAVGIGMPGSIDVKAGAVSHASNVPGFADRVEIGPLLSNALSGVRVALANDVSAGVLGEHKRGAGRPYTDLLGVWVGTGVGGGLVLEGKLRNGRGAAGEIGHLVVKPGGRRCTCGRRGCLEAYAGRAAMEQRARSLVKRGHKTDLFEIMEHRGRRHLSSGVYARALENGDKMAKELIDDAVWALGIALASAQNLLDLEAIIVGGGLGDRLGQQFVDRIVEHMEPHLFTPEHRPTVVPTELKDLSGAIGAAVLAGG
jgi:glucokinase